jgi:hypothetical protein
VKDVIPMPSDSHERREILVLRIADVEIPAFESPSHTSVTRPVAPSENEVRRE